MIKNLALSGIIVFIFTIKISSAQNTQVSILEEVSYVYVEKLIAVAKENYPRIKTYASRIAISESKVSNAKLSWLSPLSLSYVYSPTTNLNLANPTFFSGYQIGFSFNLSAVLQTPATIKQSKEELKITRYDFEEYLASLTAEVKTRYFTYLQASKSLKLIYQSNQDSRDFFTSVKHKYENGEVTFENYNTAASSLATSNQGKITAEVTLLQAKVALEELLGIRLEEVPN
ncbi:MAG: TolC family protein [Sphingobacteriaceae bacterium]|nr:TolC family protein [Sphingobacteriaceae bacterium]